LPASSSTTNISDYMTLLQSRPEKNYWLAEEFVIPGIMGIPNNKTQYTLYK